MTVQAYAWSAQLARGTVSLAGTRGFPLLDRFWFGVELDDGNVLTSCQSGIARGKKDTWESRVANGRIGLTLAVGRAEEPRGITLDVTVRNLGTAPLAVRRILVAQAVLGRETAAWGPVEEWRLLRMGYTFGAAHGEDPDGRNSALVSFAPERVVARSWGVAALRFAGTTGGLVAGFVEGDRQLSWIDVRRDRHEVEFAASCELEGEPVPPGDAVRSQTFLLALHADVRDGLEEYARLVARRAAVRLKPPPTGWCSWYVYRGAATEEQVLRQARFVAARREVLPLEVIQVDDGWAPAYGEWRRTTPRYPRGLAKLAKDVRALGFTPGLWVAPFVVHPTAAVFKEHPDWLVHDDTGEPRPWDVEWAEPKVPWYALDGSHPGAQAWLKGLFAELRGLGFKYFKLDFLFLGLLAGKRHSAVTRVKAYRAGLAAIRAGAGDAYVLGCTAPSAPTVGLVDGMRTSHDIHPGGALWPSFSESMRETHQRWWAHRTLWNADHDVILVREVDGSTVDEAKSVAASVGLSGGALFASEPLDELPPDRLGALAAALTRRRAEAARPLDVFDREAPRVLSVPLGRRRWRVGVFNDSAAPRSAALDLGWWRLAHARVTAVQDGERRPLGTVAGRILTPPVPPHGVALLELEGGAS